MTSAVEIIEMFMTSFSQNLLTGADFGCLNKQTLKSFRNSMHCITTTISMDDAVNNVSRDNNI